MKTTLLSLIVMAIGYDGFAQITINEKMSILDRGTSVTCLSKDDLMVSNASLALRVSPSSFKPYPNLSNGQLALTGIAENTELVSVSLYDLKGEALKSWFTDDGPLLDIRGFNQGLYLLERTTNRGLETP